MAEQEAIKPYVMGPIEEAGFVAFNHEVEYLDLIKQYDFSKLIEPGKPTIVMMRQFTKGWERARDKYLVESQIGFRRARDNMIRSQGSVFTATFEVLDEDSSADFISSLYSDKTDPELIAGCLVVRLGRGNLFEEHENLRRDLMNLANLNQVG